MFKLGFIPSTVISCLLLFAGIGFGRWTAERKDTESPKSLSDSQHARQSVKSSDHVSVPTASREPTASHESTALDSKTSAKVDAFKPQTFHLDQPKDTEPVLSPNVENQLSELIEAPLPCPVKPMQTPANDGSLDAYGKSEDGKNIYRHFNARGELTKEGWTAPSGEGLFRSYFNSGQLRQMSWTRADQAQTSFEYDETGIPLSRYDRLPDGTKISTNYDDNGQIKEIWKTDANGKISKVR